MAPPRFARNAGQATQEAKSLWRGLRAAIVPMRAGIAGSGSAIGYELVNGLSPTVQGGLILRGEANGPSMNSTGEALGFSTTAATVAKFIPNAVPFSVFAFVVNRGSTTGQSLIGNGYLGNGGWTFQLAYPSGTGNIGLTRWGIADNPTTTLGAVPTAGAASCMGVTLDGTTARFFLNGRFENVASGSVNTPSSTGLGYQVGANSNGVAPLTDCSIHVIYVWNRVVSDSEMMRLYQDPWLPLRMQRMAHEPIVASTDLIVTQAVLEAMHQPDPAARVSQVIGEVMRSPDPALRATQVVLEAMVPQYGIARVTQAVLEVMVSQASGTGRARISQALLEVMHEPSPSVRATQIVLEAMRDAAPALRASQLALEVMRFGDPTLRVSQVALEVMRQPGLVSVPLTGQLFPRGSVPPF